MKKNDNLKNFLFNFLFVFILFYILYFSFVYVQCYFAARNLNNRTGTELMRIKIYGYSSDLDGNAVSATFSILDSNYNDIAVIERSWPGNYLAVDFIGFSFFGKTYIFPSGIYGKNTIYEVRKNKKRTTSLEKYYDDNGQCMLLGNGSTLRERENLYIISRFANHKTFALDLGFTSDYVVDLSSCESGVYYTIRIDDEGQLVLEKF